MDSCELINAPPVAVYTPASEHRVFAVVSELPSSMVISGC
jgi:hypothetical protein